MSSIRARKVRRDLRRQWGRATGVVIAMALAVLATTALSTSFYLAKTQQRSGYLATNPPSATILTDGVTQPVLDQVLAVPGVAAADAGRTLSARIRRQGDTEWQTLRLTARSDAANTIARLTPRTGAWPPLRGQIVLERSGLQLLSGVGTGATVELELPGQPARQVTVAGTNSDPGLPPGWVEGMLYGYVTPDTLSAFGVTAGLDELRLLVDGDRLDKTHIRTVADTVNRQLDTAGVQVRSVDVPEPGHHPHQDLMDGMLQLEILFGGLILVLSVLLTVTVTSGLLAGQIRQIGTLKTLGARTGQVAAGYLTTAAVLAGVACLVGWPLGRQAGLGFVGFIAQFMNFDVADTGMPWWLVTAQVLLGLAVPLAATGLIVLRAARITAAQAIRDHGVTAPRPAAASARLAGWLSARTRLPRMPVLGARNAFRRRGRLFLAAGALAVGGATFMAAGNVADGLAATFVEQTLAAEPYDLTIVLDRAYADPTIDAAVTGTAGVTRAERWVAATATSATGDTLQLSGAPAASPDLNLRVVNGQWLSTDDGGQLVVSKAYADDHGTTIGSDVTLRFQERTVTWRVAGVAVQIGGPDAWAGVRDLADAAGTPNAANVVRLVTASHTDGAVTAVQRDLERRLGAAGATMVTVRTSQDVRTVLVAHQVIFAVFLNLITLVSVIVGGFGLATILTVAVTERTREIGVLRAVGATNRSLRGLVVTEAVVIGAVSWALAAALLAVPATLAFDALFGNLLLGVPLAFTINGWVVAGWLALVCLISALASLVPARRAGRMTVSRALAYE